MPICLVADKYQRILDLSNQSCNCWTNATEDLSILSLKQLHILKITYMNSTSIFLIDYVNFALGATFIIAEHLRAILSLDLVNVIT